MAAPRFTALPIPGYPTEDQRRAADVVYNDDGHIPSAHGSPLSSTPSSSIGFNGKSQAGITLPFSPVVTHGALLYGNATASAGSPIKVGIQAVIYKGFFLSDGEWTCYRRNYFSCNCSYSLSPYYPNANMQYIENGSTTSYQVFGFAMSISAVVAESNSQNIDLVQHTPKRKEGPVAKPEKVRMLPKPDQQASTLSEIHSDHSRANGSRAIHEGGYGQAGQGQFATEHMFERVQFKQATANNYKRRARQQYYHLLVELYVDVSTQNPGDPFIKIAEQKSARMIVRGRSPEHYRIERGHFDIGIGPMIYPSIIYEGVRPRHGIEMYARQHEPDAMLTGSTTSADINAQDGYHSKYMPDDDSVSESISEPSILSSLGDSSTRATSHSPRQEILKASADFLAEMLLQDVELRKLFKLALENPKIGGDRFQRNFRKILVAYSKDLRAIAVSELHYQASVAVERVATSAAQLIRRAIHPESGITLANIKALKSVDRAETMEKFLQKLPTNVKTKEGIDPPTLLNESNLHTPSEGSSKSDGGLEDNLNDENKLPALQLMKAFLMRDPPLATLRERLQTFVNSELHSRQFSKAIEITDSHPPDVESEKKYDQYDQPETQLTALERGIPVQMSSANLFLESLPDFVNHIMRLLHFPVWRPPIPPGMGRVRWKCKCGTKLYDDYVERKPGALKDLEAKLRAANGGISQSSNSITPNFRTYFPALFNLMKQMILPPRGGRSGNEIPLAIANDPRRANNPSPSRAGIFHLLCCIHTDMTGITLHQERMENMNTDKQVMSMLGEIYKTKRRIKSWFTMRDVSHLRLVKFSLDFSCFVQVYKHATSCQHPNCFCLPELNRVRQREYHCQPAPEDTSDLDPILGDNYLLHYLKNPQCIDDKQISIFNQLPKRATGRLAASHRKRELGWGVYFEEGWHIPTVYCVFVGFFGIASAAFGVTWSVWKADVQSAFTIASFLTALGALLLGSMMLQNG